MSYYFLERYPRPIVDHNGLKTDMWPIWFDTSENTLDDGVLTIVEEPITPEDETTGDVQFVAYFGTFDDAVDILGALNNEIIKPVIEPELELDDAPLITRYSQYEDDDEDLEDYLEPVELPEDVDSFFKRQFKGEY